MKKLVSFLIVLYIFSAMLSCFAFAQQPDVTFEHAYDMPGEELEKNQNKMTLSLMSESEPLPSSFNARDYELGNAYKATD